MRPAFRWNGAPSLLVAICFPVFLSFAQVALSQEVPIEQANDKPMQVEVGVWVSGVHDIDIPRGSFGIEFYTWWVRPDAQFRPFDEIQILNGRNWSVKSISQRKLPNGQYYSSGIVSATVNFNWHLHKFPYDSHKLQVIIETPLTASELRILPNRTDSRLSNLATVQGYQIKGIDLEERIEQYNTNFGLPDAAADRFSRLVIAVEIERRSNRLVISMLIGFIVANIVTLLTYGIHVSNLAIRVAMCGGAIFGAVGNMYSLNSALNPAVGSLLIDRFAIGSFAAIVIALGTAIVVERFMKRGKSRRAHQVNRLIFYAVLVTSIGYYGLAFYEALAPL